MTRIKFKALVQLFALLVMFATFFVILHIWTVAYFYHGGALTGYMNRQNEGMSELVLFYTAAPCIVYFFFNCIMMIGKENAQHEKQKTSTKKDAGI